MQSQSWVSLWAFMHWAMIRDDSLAVSKPMSGEEVGRESSYCGWASDRRSSLENDCKEISRCWQLYIRWLGPAEHGTAVRNRLAVRIAGSHPADRGSIPRYGSNHYGLQPENGRLWDSCAKNSFFAIFCILLPINPFLCTGCFRAFRLYFYLAQNSCSIFELIALASWPNLPPSTIQYLLLICMHCFKESSCHLILNF